MQQPDFASRVQKSAVERQAWKPRWLRDDFGSEELDGYEAKIAGEKELALVHEELWEKNILYTTEPEQTIVIRSPYMEIFEKTYPQFAATNRRKRER